MTEPHLTTVPENYEDRHDAIERAAWAALQKANEDDDMSLRVAATYAARAEGVVLEQVQVCERALELKQKMTDETAIQHILDGPEQAQELLETVEVLEEEDDEDEWELRLFMEREDLPTLKEEVAEVANAD